MGEAQEHFEQLIYRRDDEVARLQGQLESLLVDFHLLKATFEHFTEDHWHPFQRAFFCSHPCSCWMGGASSPLCSSPEEESIPIPVPPPPSRSGRSPSSLSIPSLESITSSNGNSDCEELQEGEGSEMSSQEQESTSEDESEVECSQASG